MRRAAVSADNGDMINRFRAYAVSLVLLAPFVLPALADAHRSSWG